MPNPAIDEVLRHHATDRLVPVWRSDHEAQQWDHHDRVVGTALFMRVFSVILVLLGCAMVAGTVANVPAGGDTTNRVTLTVIVFVAAAIVFVSTGRSLANARHQRTEVAPFQATPAAAWAYAAMLGNPSSDHSRAEQFRTTLDGLTPTEQVATPEHAALLVLGQAAAASPDPTATA